MLLALQGIQKSFGGVRALREGNLEVREGEVHLLMGENGAGKSTLMKIVAGMYQRDAGQMLWRGQLVSFSKPSEASANGIAMVHQESLLAPHLTIAENMFLGRETTSRNGWIRRDGLIEKASRIIAQHGFKLDPKTRVERLTPAGKQLVEICRAISQSLSLLIFDEPTSSLSERESNEVFRIVRELSARKVAVIYITHRLEELRSVGDRVTVLRDGATVHTSALVDLTRDQLIEHMVGRPVNAPYRRQPHPPGEVLLSVRELCRGMLKSINFDIRAGEIVGLAGLIGAGRTELCRVLFGIDPAEKGTIEIAGHPIVPKSPREAVRARMALIPEDRQFSGLAPKLSVAHNLSLPNLGHISTFGFLNKRSEASLAEEFRNRFRMNYSAPLQQAGRLSGGNQQKLVIAKWVARGARVFLFDEPTRGIDVNAKQEVFEQLDRLARSGGAILMVSSELPELIQIADRILVMSNGTITGELPGRTTQEEVMRLAAPATESRLIERA